MHYIAIQCIVHIHFRVWLSKLVPDCDVPALSVGLHGASLLRDLHGVLHGLLKALGLPLHHLALVLCANLSLDLSSNRSQ